MRFGLLLAALLLASVAACGKSKEPEPATSSSAPVAAENAKQAPADSPGLPADAAQEAVLGPIPADAQQLLVSITSDWTATDAELWRFQRDERGDWQPIGARVASTIGRTGLAWGRGTHEVAAQAGEPIKAEGDGKSPAGVFAIGKAYGYDDAPSDTALPYQRSTASWRCVNDSRSQFYNRVIDSAAVKKDWSEAETMRRRDELYRLVVEIDHNRIVPADLAPVPQGGSCIFLHVWRKPGAPTIGCTAMSLEDMQLLLGWLDPARRPHFVALPRARYDSVRASWKLPPLPDPS